MGKKKRKASAWNKHVKEYAKTHSNLSFKQALKGAAKTYKKGSKSTAKPSYTGKAKSKSSGKSMTRHYTKKRKKRKADKRIPILVTIPAVYRLTEGIGHFWLPDGYEGNAYEKIQNQDFGGALRDYAVKTSVNFTGYNFYSGKFHFMEPIYTYLGMAMGWLGGKLATKFGVNRAISKIPVLGKYIKM